MATVTHHRRHFSIFSLILLFVCKGVTAATFTFVNKCGFTVWPGILGSPKLDSTGFELKKGGSRSFQAPTGWSGRFWGRTGCNFDSSGRGSCATGDCGSGQLECNGAGAAPPATLAEFTLGSGAQDFYDVSLVDGYNLPIIVEGSEGSGTCASTGCISDLNRSCPNELKAEGGAGCRSACEAFGNPEYCCSGAYNSPATCKPSMYSSIFKNACPKSYSYAYDDATSTFTCSGADYTITFCPTSPSLKSASNPPPMAPVESGSTEGSGSGSGSGSGPGSDAGSGSGSEPGSGSGQDQVQAASLASSWMANLATGDSTRRHQLSVIQSCVFVAISVFVSFQRL